MYLNITALKNTYAPYNSHPAFELGYSDGLAGRADETRTGVAAQAYDRGLEAGNKVRRADEWTQRNVGMN